MIDSYNDMHKVKLQNEVEAMTKHMTVSISSLEGGKTRINSGFVD
jgi:hypothetical protein